MSEKLLVRNLLLTFFMLGTMITFWVTVEASPSGKEMIPTRLGLNHLKHFYPQYSDSTSLDFPQLKPALSLVPWSSLVYQSYRDNNWEIYFADESFSSPIRLTNDNKSDIHPSLNRGTSRIAFASNRDGDYEIFTMNTDGTGLIQLTLNSGDDVNPQWSPDGTRIAFESYRDGQAEIYVMNANGSSQTRMTLSADYDASPSWSPDSSKLAFTSRRTGGYRIYTINIDGSGLVQVSIQPYSLHPAWSPDGKQIAFDADADGDGWQDLWLMNSDGSDQRIIYNPAGQKDALARSWSPDGRYVAFTEISFVQNGGNWYWTNANIYGFDIDSNSYTSLGNNSLDWNPYWQATDARAPESEIYELPEYSQATDFQVTWSGTDFEESGITGYDIQYRLGNIGLWTDWQVDTMSTSENFFAIPGTNVQFRSRAYDYVNNLEGWPINADTATKFYTWYLAGQVTDNRQNPLIDIPVTISPSPWATTKTGEDGIYEAWLIADGSHTLTVNDPDYSSGVPTEIEYETIDTLYLSPQDNVIQNGTFEEDMQSLVFWDTSGTLPLSVTSNYLHSGQNSVYMGLDCPAPCLSETQVFPWADYAAVNLKTDSNGNLHALWSGALLGEPERSYYSFRSADGSWSEPLMLSSESVGLPVAAIDRADTLHLLWSDANGVIYYTQRSALGVWSSTSPVASINNTGTLSTMLIDRSGGIHVLILYNSGFSYLQKSIDDDWQIINIFDGYSGTAAMGLGPDDGLHFVWSTDTFSSSSRFPILYRVRYPNGKWSPIESLFEDQDYFVPEPYELIVTKNGTIHVMWRADNMLNHAYRLPNENWTTPIVLPLSHSTTDTAVDSQGNIYLINIDRSTANGGVYYRRWSQQSGWEIPIVLNSEYPQKTPAIAIDPYDIVHLMWTNGAWEGVRYLTSAKATTTGTSQLSQSIAVPNNMTNPTLAFMVRRFRDLPGDLSGLELLVSDGNSITNVPISVYQADWSHVWVDMSTWQGQTISVTFQMQQQAGDLFVKSVLDDVSLGSAYPDIWVKIDSNTTYGLPDDQVDLYITYGNQSSINVQNAILTVTLPSYLDFQNANISPNSTNPLIWNVVDLPADTQGDQIIITAKVNAFAPFFETLSTIVDIESTSAELQTTNNQDIHDLFISRFTYLPIIHRE